MELFGPSEPTVHCELRNALSSGDAEDEFRVTLSGKDAPTIQLELLATAAFPQDRWWICGTAGGLRGGAAGLEWKWVDWSTMPARPLDIRPTEGRSYNGEKLPWQTGSWTAASAADAGAGAPPARQPALDLYANLHQAIRSGGAQIIPPIATRRRIAVLEACYRQCGIPFPKAI